MIGREALKKKMFGDEKGIEAIGLKKNPFYPDPLVGDLDLFINREEELRSFGIALQNESNIILIGDTGVGKSSLSNLGRMASTDRYVWGIANWDPKSPRRVLISLLYDMIRISFPIKDERPEEIRKILSRMERYKSSAAAYPMPDIIEDILSISEIEDKREIIVLDNFYKFKDSGIFFDAFLCDLATSNCINSIVCIMLPESIEDLKKESEGLYQRFGTHIELYPFPDECIIQIIQKRVETVWDEKKENPYHPFTREAVDVIVENADGNARDAILFAQAAIDKAITTHSKIIEPAMLTGVITKLHKTLIQRYVQQYGKTGEQILKHIIKNSGHINIKELKAETKIKSNGPLEYRINKLLERGIIIRESRGKYTVPLEDELKTMWGME